MVAVCRRCNWGPHKALAFLDEARDIPGQAVDRSAVEEKLGWLRDYREALYHWSVLLAIAEMVERYVRREGYHATAADSLRGRLAGLAINASAEKNDGGCVEIRRGAIVASRVEASG